MSILALFIYIAIYIIYVVVTISFYKKSQIARILLNPFIVVIVFVGLFFGLLAINYSQLEYCAEKYGTKEVQLEIEREFELTDNTTIERIAIRPQQENFWVKCFVAEDFYLKTFYRVKNKL